MNSTTTATPRRSRLVRAAALTVGVLSVAGFALIGGGSAASATAPAAAPAAEVAAQPPGGGQRGGLCVEIDGRWGGGDESCGRLITVRARGGITALEAEWEGRRGDREVCVALGRIRGGAERDCSDERAEVDLRRGVARWAGIRVEDERLCVRSASRFGWGRWNCGREDGWVIAGAFGRGGLDGLQILVVRGRR